jgi:hypothetical protein
MLFSHHLKICLSPPLDDTASVWCKSYRGCIFLAQLPKSCQYKDITLVLIFARYG